MNKDARIIPQKIKNLFKILSAKNPNTGCIIDEQICEMLIIIVAIPIVNPNFDAIKGIIGFKKPLYTSAVRCARHSQIIAFFTVFFSKSINKYYIAKPCKLSNSLL